MEDAILLVETGWTQDVLDNAPESLLNNMMLYRAIKNVIQNGGELQI
jgi:hypothetical protein